MKKASDSLFQLIRSMSGQEKRYFKLYASRHSIGGKNNYVKLFEVIDAQKVYDEGRVRTQLKNEKFVQQLFVVKNYLYEMLLKSLDGYYAEKSIDVQLNQSIHFIEILYNKALYDQCERVLERAERIAIKHERLIPLLEIVNWKFRLMKDGAVNSIDEQEMSALYQYQHELAGKVANYFQLQWLNTKLFSKALQKGWFPRSSEEIELEYKPILAHAVFEDESQALSLRGKILYHNTVSAFYHLKGETASSYQHSKRAEKIVLDNPGIIINNAEDYIACLSNLVFTSMFLGKYEETFLQIDRLKKINTLSRSSQAKIFTAAFLPELITHNITGNLTAGHVLIPEIENQLNMFGELIPQHDVLYIQYNIACIYFKSGDVKNASRWLFKVLNNGTIIYLTDLHAKARILNLITQSELANADLLPYAIRSTYRFLLKQHRLYRFERTIIRFLRTLPDVPAGEMKLAYSELRKTLLVLCEDQYEKRAMEFFGLLEWLEKKSNS